MTELPDDVLELQRLAFRYFLCHTNAGNGLVADNTRADSPCSIAATGLGLSRHPVAVNKGWLKRAEAAERVTVWAARIGSFSGVNAHSRFSRQTLRREQVAL